MFVAATRGVPGLSVVQLVFAQLLEYDFFV